MRETDAVLGIIRERGRRKLPLNEVYRQLYNPHLYLLAYDRLRTNKGALTPGVTEETIDAMSVKKIEAIIEQVRHERYRWTPTKRVYIPKKSGKRRALGLPTWADKLLQEVVRLLLEAYYEPLFSRHSHGFRPERGCHTALNAVGTAWTGTRWFIEGDIAQCFDRLDHDVLLAIMGETINDNRFLRVIANMLKAGYLEEWTYHATLSGSPQGGVISPILSNIYLDKLDEYVETHLMRDYNYGKGRATNPEYRRALSQAAALKRQGMHEEAKRVRQYAQTLPSHQPDDPQYRRLRYVRYADDFLLGFDGPKDEAKEIREKLRTFLGDKLKLELSTEKTLITHAATEKARFLGYDIYTQWSNTRMTDGRRSASGRIGLRIPKETIDGATKRYMRAGKPIHRSACLSDSDYGIVVTYQREYRGLVNYYLLAHNVESLSAVQYVSGHSLLQTLAAKHRSSVRRMVQKYKATTQTPYGAMVCFRVVVDRGENKRPLVAEFGGLPLRRQRLVRVLNDDIAPVWNQRSDLVSRLLANKCELCGVDAQEKLHKMQVHHIKKLADLKQSGRRELPEWKKRMIALRRKTLVVCHNCHVDIHAGRPPRRQQHDNHP